MRNMSAERMRVAISDWCASRNVVSVISGTGLRFMSSATASGPPDSRTWRMPSTGRCSSMGGAFGFFITFGILRPATWALPFTTTSPM